MPAISFARFVTEVENLYRPPERSVATYRKMRQVLREFGELGINSTKGLDDQAVVKWKAAHPGRSPWTVRSLLLSFRSAVNIAKTKRYIRFSPFDVRKLNKWVELEEPECVRHHSLDSIGVVLGHLYRRSFDGWHEHRLFALTSTVAYTGIRAGEAQHAWVKDFDLESGIMAISPRRKKKTRASAQPVPIPGSLRDILARWLPEAGPQWAFPGTRREGPWVGGTPGYKPLDRLKDSALQVGVKGFTFQSLRHSWATHAEGPWQLSDPEIARNLRHTSIRTSKDSYRHPDLDNLRAIGDRVAIPFAS